MCGRRNDGSAAVLVICRAAKDEPAEKILAKQNIHMNHLFVKLMRTVPALPV